MEFGQKVYSRTRVCIFGVANIIFLLAGCASGQHYGHDAPITTVEVPAEQLLNTPLLPKLSAIAGIHYSESFRAASAITGGGDSPRVRYKFGDAAVAMFDLHAAAMFAQTVEQISIPKPGNIKAPVDIVLVPSFKPLLNMVFHEPCAPTTVLSGINLSIDVLAPDGANIAKVETAVTTPSISGIREGGCKQQTSLESYTGLLTEAVGDLSIALFLSPELGRWADHRNIEWQWPQESYLGGESRALAGVTIVICSGLYGCSSSEGSVAVGEALRTLDPSVEIIPAEDLVEALYPLLGRRSLTDKMKMQLLLSPAAASRACNAGVRHLIVADEIDRWKTGHGVVGVSPLGGGIGVGGQKTHESAYIRVVDFLDIKEAGEIKHQRERISMVIPVVGIPVPIPIPTIGDEMHLAIAKQLLPLLRAPR